MKIIETEAIILKSISLAEADKIVSCLTRQAGLVRLSVRGARRLKSRFSGRLEPFTIAEITYGQKEDSELGKLFQAEIVESYFPLAKRLNVLNAMSYLSEILTAITPAQESNDKLYRMARACLAAVNEVNRDLPAVRFLVAYFELWLLRLAGFLPDFQSCSNCRRKITQNPVYYISTEARLLCSVCAAKHRLSQALPADLHKVLRAALVLPPQKFVETAKKINVQQEAIEEITHRLLRKILEYDPQYWSQDFEFDEIEQIEKVG